MKELKNKSVITRKFHRCEWCGEVIAAGERAQYRALIFEGEFVHGWQHIECYVAMDNSDPDLVREGWSEGENLRGKILE